MGVVTCNIPGWLYIGPLNVGISTYAHMGACLKRFTTKNNYNADYITRYRRYTIYSKGHAYTYKNVIDNCVYWNDANIQLCVWAVLTAVLFENAQDKRRPSHPRMDASIVHEMRKRSTKKKHTVTRIWNIYQHIWYSSSPTIYQLCWVLLIRKMVILMIFITSCHRDMNI